MQLQIDEKAVPDVLYAGVDGMQVIIHTRKGEQVHGWVYSLNAGTLTLRINADNPYRRVTLSSIDHMRVIGEYPAGHQQECEAA